MSLEKFVRGAKRVGVAAALAAGLTLATVGCQNPVPKPKKPDHTAEINTITKAANRLDELQDTNGGWDWTVTNATGPSGTTYKNLFGITAGGLLAAYEETGNQEFLVAAEKTADHLAAISTTDAIGSGSNSVYSQDIEFLTEIGKVTKNAAYTDAAKNFMDAFLTESNRYVSHANMTAAELDSAYQAVFPTSGGNQGETEWALSSWVRAAKDTGHGGFASDLATQMANDMPGYFDPSDSTGQNCYILGLAGEFDATGSSSIEQKLKNLQQSDGTWSDPNGIVQNTAYATMALEKAKDMTDAYKGVSALMKKQLANGGWIESDANEYAEVDSEAIMAISGYLIQ